MLENKEHHKPRQENKKYSIADISSIKLIDRPGQHCYGKDYFNNSIDH
jgi:hypothetical protein